MKRTWTDGELQMYDFNLYTPGGQLAATVRCGQYQGYTPACYNGGGPYAYLAGKRVTTSWWLSGLTAVTDRLGSVREKMQDGWGPVTYYPYGEAKDNPLPDGNFAFGTYMRDGQGLDYAMNRYYSAGLGRFYSPDPGGLRTANPSDPGSWNRYAYVQGDPVNFNDPNGEFRRDPDFGGWGWDSWGGGGSCGPGWMWDASLSGPCGGGGGGGGYSCAIGNSFAPVPNPGCNGPEPEPEQPTQPVCDEEMYTRPISGLLGLAGLVASHQYIVVNDGRGNEWTIEGEPERSEAGNWGNLVSSYHENGYGAHDDPTKDKVFGGDWVIPCIDISDLVTTAKAFSGTAKYKPLGPNSNSFMHWFLGQTGLDFYYPTPPPGAIGWYDPIPGN